MCLWKDEIYVEFHAQGNIMTVPPVKTKSYQGYRQAKRDAAAFLKKENEYVVADFFSEKGTHLKELRVNNC